jgi:hypothetical protein
LEGRKIREPGVVEEAAAEEEEEREEVSQVFLSGKSVY